MVTEPRFQVGEVVRLCRRHPIWMTYYTDPSHMEITAMYPAVNNRDGGWVLVIKDGKSGVHEAHCRLVTGLGPW